MQLVCSLLCVSLLSGCLGIPFMSSRDGNVAERELKERYGVEFDTISVKNLEFGQAMIVPHEVHKVVLSPVDNKFIRCDAEIKYADNGSVESISDNYNEVIFAYSLYPKIRSFEQEIEEKLSKMGITAYCEIAVTRTYFLEGYDVGETLYDFMNACAAANAERLGHNMSARLKISLAVQDDGEDVDVIAAKLEQFIRDFSSNELRGEFCVTYESVYYQSRSNMEAIRRLHSKLMCDHYLNDEYGSDVNMPRFYDEDSEEYKRYIGLHRKMDTLSDTLTDEWVASLRAKNE